MKCQTDITTPCQGKHLNWTIKRLAIHGIVYKKNAKAHKNITILHHKDTDT